MGRKERRKEGRKEGRKEHNSRENRRRGGEEKAGRAEKRKPARSTTRSRESGNTGRDEENSSRAVSCQCRARCHSSCAVFPRVPVLAIPFLFLLDDHLAIHRTIQIQRNDIPLGSPPPPPPSGVTLPYALHRFSCPLRMIDFLSFGVVDLGLSRAASSVFSPIRQREKIRRRMGERMEEGRRKPRTVTFSLLSSSSSSSSSSLSRSSSSS